MCNWTRVCGWGCSTYWSGILNCLVASDGGALAIAPAAGFAAVAAGCAAARDLFVTGPAAFDDEAATTTWRTSGGLTSKEITRSLRTRGTYSVTRTGGKLNKVRPAHNPQPCAHSDHDSEIHNPRRAGRSPNGVYWSPPGSLTRTLIRIRNGAAGPID